MPEIDWKAEARNWEARAKENRALFDAERIKQRSWREAYHSLRITLEDRLDRVTSLLEYWESDDDTPDTPTHR